MLICILPHREPILPLELTGDKGENLHRLSPVLHGTLVRLGVIPHREFAIPEELKQALQSTDQLLIDVTERLYRRSQDDQAQREHYSGKKSATR